MSTILDYINKGKGTREKILEQVREMLANGAALSAPPEFKNYGYNLSNTTIAKFRPWDEMDHPVDTALSDEALFNVGQFNRLAIAGLGYECGIYNGGVSRMLMDEGRRMVCFDTFEGVKGSHEGVDMMGDGEYACRNEDAVRALLHDAEIVKGDVRHTILNRAEMVAFAHLDMDVYSPTIVALQEIWPRLYYGGIIVCDDYGVWCTQGVRQAVDLFLDTTPDVKSIYLPTGQVVLMK